MVERETFSGWLDAYGRAREAGDPEAAADLFTDDATYHETPFDEPLGGRGGILEYWSDVPKSQRDVRFSYEVLAATEAGGVAHWRASFVRHPSDVPVDLDGIMLVKLGADGRTLHGVPRVVAQKGGGELAWTSG